MSHELLRLTEKLYSTPHLMSADSFNHVIQFLEERNAGKVTVNLGVSEDMKKKKKPTTILDPSGSGDKLIGVLSVNGALTATSYEGMCGEEGCSYESLTAQMDNLVAAGNVKTILMDIDSGGGEAFNCFPTADYIRNLADENGIRLVAYSDGCTASAAYALAAVAHEVVTHPQSMLGSIGVVVKLRNVSEAMQKMGIQDTYITSGKNKVPFDANGDFTQEYLDSIQERVDELANDFANHVAMWRGLDANDIKDLEAGMFNATKAVEIGLANKIMTHSEFISYLTNDSNSEDSMLNFISKNKTQDTSMSVEKLAQLETALADSIASFEAAKVSHAAELKSVAESFTSKLAETEASLATALAKLAAEETAKAEAKAADRNTKLLAAFGEEKAKTLAPVFAALDDVAFDTALSAFQTKQDKEDAVKETPKSENGEAIPVVTSAADKTLAGITALISQTKFSAQ